VVVKAGLLNRGGC